MFKYALVFALAGGAALFTGCRADEEVDLAGYPETPVGATISGTSDRVATFEGTYDNDGVLNLAGSLSGEYTIALAQASPEETVVRPFAGHLVLKIRSISEFHAVLLPYLGFG